MSRYTESLVIQDFGNHLDNGIDGEQTRLCPFGHSLDILLREMTLSFWYGVQSPPANPDPNGWMQFQLVQPKLNGTVVKPYPEGYTVVAKSPRITFEDLIEHKSYRVRGQGGTIRYMEPLFLVSLGYKSPSVGSGQAVWEGLDTLTASLNYDERT